MHLGSIYTLLEYTSVITIVIKGCLNVKYDYDCSLHSKITTLSLLWRQKSKSAGRIKWLAFPISCNFIYNKPRTLQHHDMEHDKTTQSCFFTFLSVIFFKLTLKSHEWKMFIKANTLCTQSQIKLHKTNNFYLKFKCNHLRWGQFPNAPLFMQHGMSNKWTSLFAALTSNYWRTNHKYKYNAYIHSWPTTLQYTFTSFESWTSYFTRICHIFRYDCIHFTTRFFGS